ncbi:hypothetical protein BH24PSE2_BH24PSE2_22370 [soil metagenome]
MNVPLDVREANKHRLTELLLELEAELNRADTVDDVGRDRMRAVQTEISLALTRREREKQDELGDLAESVQRSIDEFEKTHPRLTLTLGRILDTLNKIGI